MNVLPTYPPSPPISIGSVGSEPPQRVPYTYSYNGMELAPPKQRDNDNWSPHSSYGSYSESCYSPSPRALESPSPPTPASATKLYNLLKHPDSSYNTEDSWRSCVDFITTDKHGALNMKRKADVSDDQPMDLSCKPKRLCTQTDSFRSCTDSLCSVASVSTQASLSGSFLESILAGKQSYGLTATDSKKAWDRLDDSEYHCLLPPHCTPSPSLPGYVSISSPSSPFSSASSTCSSTSSKISSYRQLYPTVRLAKKNLLPVTARVSDWIVKLVHFTQSLPEFVSLPYSDKVSLLTHSWARLLLLFMAENGFQFAVTPSNIEVTDAEGELEEARKSDTIPTMRSVEYIQNFIQKCQNLCLDTKEYYFLKMVALFNSGEYIFSERYCI